jgi:hypothetical protein
MRSANLADRLAQRRHHIFGFAKKIHSRDAAAEFLLLRSDNRFQ